MARYLVAAPDKQSVTISSGYGTITLNHGQEVSNSKLASMFPHLFVQIQDDEQEIQVQPQTDETLGAEISEEQVEISDEGPVTTLENTPPESVVEEVPQAVAEEVAEPEIPETEVPAEVPVEVPAEKPKGRKTKEK